MNEYVITVDIAKKRDFTSIFVMKRVPLLVPGNQALKSPERIVNYCHIVSIDKFNNISYPQVVEAIALRAGHESLVNNHDLLIDGTGIGEAVVDLVRQAGMVPISIVFTGGTQPREVAAEFGRLFDTDNQRLAPLQVVKEIHVPKADLVSAGSIMAQQGRVKVAQGLRWRDDFEAQLSAFKGKVNEKTRRIKYEAETESDHDDLVVCYLMGAWRQVNGVTETGRLRPRPGIYPHPKRSSWIGAWPMASATMSSGRWRT